MTLIRKSTLTGKSNSMELPITINQFRIGKASMKAGALIQQAFPMLNCDQREFILTGITPEEWDEAFDFEGDE